jgi:hypothetical protein
MQSKPCIIFMKKINGLLLDCFIQIKNKFAFSVTIAKKNRSQIMYNLLVCSELFSCPSTHHHQME